MSLSRTRPLKPSGERAVPRLSHPSKEAVAEHLTRYGFATAHANRLRVLDVCCGVGYGAAMMATVANEVVGFDVSEKAIEYARAHYSRPNVRFEVADIFDWHEGDFDLAVAFEALEHVRDGEGFIGVLHRALKPGGRLILSTPMPGRCRPGAGYHVRCYELQELVELLFGRFGGSILRQREAAIGPGLLNADFFIFIGARGEKL